MVLTEAVVTVGTLGFDGPVGLLPEQERDSATASTSNTKNTLFISFASLS
jgi:hypothetical protein